MSAINRNWLWWAAAITLTFAKLWLTRGQGIFAIGNAGHDDLLFINLAHKLIQGEWLGPYNELTLSKGPFYPIFIAASYLTGIPLFLAQHLFYVFACAIFVRALQPAISSQACRAAIYIALLWNPMTFDMQGMGRVLRQQVYGPLALLILGGLVALYFRRSRVGKRWIPWSILTGLAAGCFYLTREETVWILPSILLLVIAHLVAVWRQSPQQTRRALYQFGFVLVIAAVPIVTVSALNKWHYGWFGTSEFRSTEFQQAYGALARVRVGPEIPLIPVTRQSREAIAKVSPRFAELQSQFDASLAFGWSKASEFFTHLPPEEEQIGGGWFMWALRDATSKAGHAHSASEAIHFYDKLAEEINLACDQNRISAGPPRSGFLPIWHREQASDFVRNLRIFTDYVARFSHFSARPNPSFGSTEQLQLFHTITGEKLSPPVNISDTGKNDLYQFNNGKIETLHRVGKMIRPVLPILIYLAQAVLLLRAVWLLSQRRWSYPLTLALATWGACAASVIIHAIIHTTSFPVLTITSFAPIYPLLLVMVIAVIWDATTAWQHRVSPLRIKANAVVTEGSAQLSVGLSRGLPWLLGLSALLPFLIWHRQFSELFWFGDDLFLLDQIALLGLSKWSTTVFSENFVPLFKVLWGQAVFTFHGSYLAMLWLLWLTHALNTALLARILQRAGFPLVATIISALIFALTPANIETLGWSVQWSAVLATCFMLIGINWLFQNLQPAGSFSWRINLVLFLCATASACSFSRGVLTGGVLALGVLLPVLFNFRTKAFLRSLPGFILCLIPAITVALIIKLNSSGNHQHLSGHWGEVLEYGLSFYLLNPASAILGDTSLHPFVMLLLSGSKISVILGALIISRGRIRILLLLLLAYDLGNALLVGIGRYHTGFLTALSSRYQYSSLLSTLPSFGLLIAAALRFLPSIRYRRWTTATLIAIILIYCYQGWPPTLNSFTSWRGTEVRQLLAKPTTSDPSIATPALEFMHVERAKALQRAYNLH